MKTLEVAHNPDLAVVEGNMSFLTAANNRRYGFHNLHRIARYAMSFRSSHVLPLVKDSDPRIARLDPVRELTGLPWFSAMVVVRGQDILFEKYAHDLGPNSVHSIQSISKTLVNLMVGRVVGSGVLSLTDRVRDYLPEIGSGYAEATLQQVLNMDVANEYTEDFADPSSTYFRHEEAMGWRLPADNQLELTQRGFLAGIESRAITNESAIAQYKDANPDVAAWVVERASGMPLRHLIADIVDAAGIEGNLHISTDRDGFPAFDGGVSMSARDLARYMSIFARKGQSVLGQQVVAEEFIERTLSGGIPMSSYRNVRYSNSMMVSERSLGHGGWCGQFALANPDNGIAAAFLSVIDNQSGTAPDYKNAILEMLLKITREDCES